MTSVPEPFGLSPSMNTALTWASGCATLRAGSTIVHSEELFLGLLLAHPDRDGEVWRLLDHFGLTVRDVLPDDYPVIDAAALRRAAAAAHTPTPDEWDVDVQSVIRDAGSRAGGRAQVIHVLASMLQQLTPWQDRLQPGLTRFGISARTLVDQISDEAVRSIDLTSTKRAGAQLGDWLAQRFPRRPATMASFSNDVPDPGLDFVGVSEEADAFAYLITSRNLIPPLAIGLFGVWGSGKSFLMAKIRQRVEQLTAMAAGSTTNTEIWPQVVAIEFNAWQYVETDLWASLLSRIFASLSPEDRSELARIGAEKDENLRQQRWIELALARLAATEQQQADAATKAAEEIDRISVEAAALRDVARTEAAEAHARSTATAGAKAAIASALGPEVAEAVGEAQALRRALAEPVWRAPRFWTTQRIVWVTVALLVASIAVVVVDARLHFAPALLAAIGVGAAILTPMLRTITSFAKDQQEQADAAANRVDEQLTARVEKAVAEQQTKEKAVAQTRTLIEAGEQKAKRIAAARTNLDAMASRLDPTSMYADFLTGRSTADDYRKRLGVVSTVSDDLATLSRLVATYNDTEGALKPGGPPNRIVLYIDDLDRCPPARVLEVLEAVHLLLAFPLFVVVVAVDTRWLTTALHEALPLLQQKARPGVARPTATDYLEKIFQIPFWVEPLDDAARHRLLRGLMLPSVAGAEGDPPQMTGTAVQVGTKEEAAATTMLSVHGAWLDLDARTFSITAAELAFVEALNPLMTGTPRQVKRFINICKLLLAMSPPLETGPGLATERTAACFMAALHQSMPAFSIQLASTAKELDGTTTLGMILADMATSGNRASVQTWVAEQTANPPAKPFAEATAAMLLKRWDVIERLRFSDDESNQIDPAFPAATPAQASVP